MRQLLMHDEESSSRNRGSYKKRRDMHPHLAAILSRKYLYVIVMADDSKRMSAVRKGDLSNWRVMKMKPEASNMNRTVNNHRGKNVASLSCTKNYFVSKENGVLCRVL
jgi:hypothetical protein